MDSKRKLISTPGGDSIWLENPSNYGLAKGISDPLNTESMDERFYVLSNLHQLHCVVRSSTKKPNLRH